MAEQGGRVAHPHPPPPQKETEPPTVWCRNTLFRMYLQMLVTSVTSLHTFSALRRLKKCLRITMKQELPEQLPTDALSQIDYGHTKQWGLDCNEVCSCQRTTQNAFLKNLNRGMCIAEWDMSPPPPRFKTRTPPLMFSLYLSFTVHYFYTQSWSFTQFFIHKNCFELFSSAHF